MSSKHWCDACEREITVWAPYVRFGSVSHNLCDKCNAIVAAAAEKALKTIPKRPRGLKFWDRVNRFIGLS